MACQIEQSSGRLMPWRTSQCQFPSVELPLAIWSIGPQWRCSPVMVEVGQQGQCECDQIDVVAPQNPGVGP